MTQYWKKLGQLYAPKERGLHPKLVSHVANPLPVHLDGDVYRVFFSGRDDCNRSSVGAVDIDLVLRKVIKEHYLPFFEHGTLGSFFADGVSIGNLYHDNSHDYVLFMAWQIRGCVHWRGDIGRLELSKDKEKVFLVDEKPFLTVDDEDLISLSYPWVLWDEGVYKMWYGSTISWESSNSEMIHVIKYATSENGEKWTKHGLALPYELGVAQAFSHPTVIKDQDEYHMWFSYRSGSGQKYRIGYAHSPDGVLWDRKSYSGIDVSETGWDSEMICYPFVFDHNGKRYMLYNGNDYGKTGFGLAVLEDFYATLY